MDLAAQLAALASLPQRVEALQARVQQLEARLAANDTDSADVLLDAAQAATLLGMTPGAVRAAGRRGSLPSVHVGRRVRFRRSELPG